jgi:hypothetical protein
MFVSDNNATMLSMVEHLCGKNVQSLLKKNKQLLYMYIPFHT